MQLNNGYQNIYLNGLDISVGGSLDGLKEQIRDILPNKVVIVSGVRVGDAKKLPIGVEVKKYITYTEEPEDWDEEEDGEFIPEEVFNLEIKNLYGYDLTIVDDVVSSAKTSIVSVEDIEAGTIENAKPIYIHPITILNSTAARLTLLIFNNSSTPFTVSSFLDYLDALYEDVGAQTRILISGGFSTSENEVLIGSYLGKSDATTYYMLGISVSTGGAEGRNFNRENFAAFITDLYDGVNKIN